MGYRSRRCPRHIERATDLLADPDQPQEVHDNARQVIEDAKRRLDAIEAARYSNPDHRPTEAETLDFLDRASTKRAYAVADLGTAAEFEAEEENAAFEERYRDEIAELVDEAGIALTEEEIEVALRYIAAGESTEYAVEAAVNDVAARSLEQGAEETGKDFYAEIAASLYTGDTAERRDSGAQEAVAGSEGVEGDQGGREAPYAEPESAGQPADVERPEPQPDLDEGSLGLTADEAQTGLTPEQQAQQAELEARQKQSMSRRGEQVGLGDQEGGLFSNERDQGDMLDAERSGDRFREIADPVEQAKKILRDGGPRQTLGEPPAPEYIASDEGRSEPLRRDSGAVSHRRGGRVRALGIADDLRREGATALGEGEIANPKELAEVAQV